jgi:anionic cell wall polymer biosynthesis LytR-Cps2A-Psr (LCP) family protein
LIEERPLPRAAKTPGAVRVKRKSPRWAKWCVGVGALLLVAGGGSAVGTQALVKTATKSVVQQDLLGTVRGETERKHADIKGAKNILLVGLDTRPGQDPSQLTRSDSIILFHIPPEKSIGYLISLPRDSFVEIPPYNNGAVPWGGGKSKINAAFAFGSRGLTGQAALSHGFELLAKTVKEVTGITPDAGGIIDFQGFKQVVNVLGRVCMYVDEDTTSIHFGVDKNGKVAAPYKINPDGTLNHKIYGVTPNFYKKGNQCLNPSQALDFVRQRDLLADHDYDYGRQRHQQQFIKAVLKQVVADGLDSPAKLPSLLTAVGKTMTVDSGGIPLEDWAFAMRNLNPDNLVTIKTNEGKFNPRTIPGIGSVEILSPDSLALMQAVKNDTVPAFLTSHPTWIAAN